jgi:hypothetical protein
MDYFEYLATTNKNYRVKYYEKGNKKGTAMRKLCKECNKRPAAVNYHKEGKTYYRSKCDHCARGLGDGVPRWKSSGYQLKLKCDKCGYASKYHEQFNVYHIDGNLDNCRHTNLKSVCANCQRLLHVLGLPWKQGDLVPDF